MATHKERKERLKKLDRKIKKKKAKRRMIEREIHELMNQLPKRKG